MKKSKKRRIIIISVLLVFVLLVGGVGFYAFSALNRIKGANITDARVNDSMLDYAKKSDVQNVLILGVDSRPDEIESTEENHIRSDVIMVASFDKTNTIVSLTSFERDVLLKSVDPSYVVDGYTNLNHAYQYGGVEDIIQTLNTSFDLDIEDYIVLNFWAVEKIIDRVGGVEVTITQEELPYANNLIKSLNNYSDGAASAYLTSAGTQILNGRQAVGYMRIRSTAGADYKRMERQRTVLITMLSSMNHLGIGDVIPLINECTPYMVTNLTLSEMTELAKLALSTNLANIPQYQMPMGTDKYTAIFWSSTFYHEIMTNLSGNVKAWHEAIYQREYTVPDHIYQLEEEIKNYAASQQ